MAKRRRGTPKATDDERRESLDGAQSMSALPEGWPEAVKVHEQWAGSVQTPVAPGRQRDPLVNHPGSARSGHLASGHEISPSRIGAPESGDVLDYHVVEPSNGTTIQWHTPGPLSSALAQHHVGSALTGAGEAVSSVSVQSMDQARASQPGLMSQLGDRAPMGISGAQRDMPAGTAGMMPGQGTGDAPRPVPPRPGMSQPTGNPAYEHVMNRDYARPLGSQPRRPAPGSQYTSHIPGER